MQKSSKSDASDLGKSMKKIVLSSIFVVFTHVHQMRKSDQKYLKNEAKTLPNPLKKHAHFDAKFCVEKLTTFNRIWTPKRVQVDPTIDTKSIKHRKMQNSKIIEMQKMQKSSKSDAPDLERTPKVVEMMPKSDKKSSHN